MKKLLLSFILGINLFAADNISNNTDSGITDFNNTLTSEQTTKLKAPLLNLFESTQWNLFLREFEMSMDVGKCCRPGDILSCAIGIKAHMIEPIGYIETTKKPLYFPFAEIDLKGNIVKGNSQFESCEDDACGRGTAYDAHFIYVPIMGMIFKKTMTFVCFHKGDLVIPYMSEFDPTWKQDFYYGKMIPHMLSMFTPQGLLSTIFDCVSTEIVNGLVGAFDGEKNYAGASQETLTSMDGPNGDLIGNSNKQSDISKSTMDKMNMIRDTMYFVDGCSGFTSVGGYVHGDDVIQDATLLFHGIMSLLHGVSAVSPVPFLYKQTNIHVNTASFPRSAPEASILDTMCTWRDYALPLPSQYLLQLAYPTVGSAKEGGSTGASVSTAKNVPGSYGAVFTVWVRRDYYAFAYFCQEEEKKTANVSN